MKLPERPICRAEVYPPAVLENADRVFYSYSHSGVYDYDV